MAGNLLEQKIIGIFNKDITKLYSINSISKLLKTSYPHINQKVNSLIKDGIIKKITIGKSHMCSMDLKSDLAISYLSIDEINNKKKKLITKSIKEFSKSLIETKKTKNIIFSNKTLYVLIDEEDKKYFSRFKKEFQKNIIFANEQEFKEILLKDSKIVKDHIILQSYESYFKLLKEIHGQMIYLNLK